MILILLLLNLINAENLGEYLGDGLYVSGSNDGTRTYSYVYAIERKKDKGNKDRRKLLHLWENFKWRKNNGDHLRLSIGDCSSNSFINWSPMLQDVIYHWNNVPQFQTGSGIIYTPKNASMEFTSCNNGMVRFYNARSGQHYGDNGYLGIATLLADRNNYIGVVNIYMNEYYLKRYNINQIQGVICHEVGHSWPLGHPDTSGADLDTCMDYSRELDNKYGNKRDIDVVNYIYSNISLPNYDNDDKILNKWKKLDLEIKIIIILSLLIILCSCSICYYSCNKTNTINEEPGGLPV